MAESIRYCVVIPAFREGGRIGAVVQGVRAQGPTVLVVDDGSPDQTAAEAEKAGALVLRHGTNRGKGATLNSGFEYARTRGFDAVITLDADGQHDPAEVARFMDTYERTRIPVLVGNRMAEVAGMPAVRRLTNRFMSWLLSRRMGQFVPDTQCGYRLYRCDLIPLITTVSAGFAAESENLLTLADHGIAMGSVRIRTIYGDEKSKIHPVKDTIRFVHMLWRHRRQRPTPSR